MKLVTHTCITWVHLSGVSHNSSYQSACMRVFVLRLLDKASVKSISSFVPRQRLCKQASAATNTHNSRSIVGRMCLLDCLCITLKLLGDKQAKTFQWQRRIVGHVVFYAVRVVSKERRRLVVPKTSCIIFFSEQGWGKQIHRLSPLPTCRLPCSCILTDPVSIPVCSCVSKQVLRVEAQSEQCPRSPVQWS